jgi:parallel beta-helix repeat protein
MENKHLLILFSLVLGLGLTLAFILTYQGNPISAVSVAAQAGTVPTAATAAELRVCLSGCTYSSVQAAVDAAEEGDIIKVAAGTYTDLNDYGGHTQVVYIDKTITIQGGYTTTNWTTLDPNANPTTLNAHLDGRVIYITGNVSPTIEGLRITRGVGDYLGPSDKYQRGGGICVVTATVTLRNNQIIDNHAYAGGGVYLKDSASTISENTIASCTAPGIGGMYLDHSDALIAGNVISDNYCSGLYLDNSDATLLGNTISHNECSWGGGLILYQSNSVLSQNMIISNFAEATGGGIFVDQSSVTLTNNVIADNQINDYDGSGGGLYAKDSHLYLWHTTIARNFGGEGSGQGVYLDQHATLAATNTIIAEHNVGIAVINGSTATLEGTLWYSNGLNTKIFGIISTSTILTGTVNVYGDPAFVDPMAWDYHLSPGSVAIDAGVNAGITVDIDGDPRSPTRPDIGADEIRRIYLPLVERRGGGPSTNASMDAVIAHRKKKTGI